MFSFYRLYSKHASSGIKNHKALYAISFLVLFFGIFDGIISYVSPLVITQSGFSQTMMGIIIGTSSVAGAVFDFLLCKFLKTVHFRRVFIIMFLICFLFPLLLWQASTALLFVVAMVLWGLYYDLFNFGHFDFVARHTTKEEHSYAFGVIQFFQSVGYLIAPLAAGFLIADAVDWQPFLLAWIFLFIAFCFFIILNYLTRNERQAHQASETPVKRNLLLELDLWEKVGKIIFPVLALTFFLNIIDSFFWTIGPLLAESFDDFGDFEGIFLTAYSLPALIVSWFVGMLTIKYGKKKTAFKSLLAGSAILSSLFFISNPFFIIAIIFLASGFIAVSWPSINGAYADYIEEAPKFEKEIEGVQDFFTNIGYIVGPILAGLLADVFGNLNAFAIVGVLGVFVASILIKITPKEISLKISD